MWNYRVVKKSIVDDFDDEIYAVHEVFYDDDGNPVGCTEKSVRIGEYSLKSLSETIDLMKQALDKPVLDYKDFERLEE